eukprot:3109152-Rhodomonas_salina.1
MYPDRNSYQLISEDIVILWKMVQITLLSLGIPTRVPGVQARMKSVLRHVRSVQPELRSTVLEMHNMQDSVQSCTPFIVRGRLSTRTAS